MASRLLWQSLLNLTLRSSTVPEVQPPARSFFAAFPSHQWQVCWALLPLLAFLFACNAGRDWPFQVGPNFPRLVERQTHPTATAATLLVYSPDERTMRLRAELQAAEPLKSVTLQIAVWAGNALEISTASVQAAGPDGLRHVSAPLRFKRGINLVKFSLGAGNLSETPFYVLSLRVTQSIFEPGNWLFCLTLAAVAAGSILAARAIGANGLNLFCSASLIGFLLLTSTGTLLSPFHLLTGWAWAGFLTVASVALGTAATLRLRQYPPAPAEPSNTLRPLEAAVLLALTCPVFLMAILAPITRWDDLMYHGSRAAYWRQNASALPFVSHNDRLSVFPIGGDLLFAAGTIISGAELPGKFLVSLAFPLILFAMLALLKNAGIRSPVALGVVAVFATAPMVMDNGVGIKPDLWLVLLGIITLHWVLEARRGGSALSAHACACLAAAGAGAALGVKWTAAPLLFLVPFALLRPGGKTGSPRRWLAPVAAFSLAVALGGAGPILLFNLETSHHPFGPKEMRAWHQPDPGWHPALVQLKRLPFLLLAPPHLPSQGLQELLDRWETRAAEAVGATESLWRENGSDWPGRFVPGAKRWDDGFSLGWLLVALGLPAGLYILRRPTQAQGRSAFLLISGLTAVSILAVVTQTRWQVAAALPERFLLPAFGFGVLALAWPADRLLAHGGKPARVWLSTLVGLHMLPFCALALAPFRFGAQNDWQTPASAQTGSELSPIIRRLPPGRTILLLADQSCRDYPLFRAREGFANRVLPWGKAAYNSSAFARSLHQPGVDTVIFAAKDRIDLIWEPPVDARPFIQDMDSRPDFWRLPGTGNLVVYCRKV